ncbi:rhodanese-like domain-containing protein [Phycisphaeraceae bacterium D3-23]
MIRLLRGALTVAVELDAQGVPAGYPFQPGWEVSPRAVSAMCQAGDGIVLLDCRLDKEVAAASIAGAVHVPMQSIADRLDELEEHVDDKVVVFCHGGVRSMRVVAFLRERGFEDVWSMAGGIDLWSLSVDTKVPRY